MPHAFFSLWRQLQRKKLTPEVREKLRCGGVNFGAEGLTMKQCCDLMSTLDLALLENKKQPKTKFAVLEALLRLVQKALGAADKVWCFV